MPEIGLDCSRILTIGGELEAAPMPQHVRMDQEAELGDHASTGDHPLIARHAERRASLRDKHVG